MNQFELDHIRNHFVARAAVTQYDTVFLPEPSAEPSDFLSLVEALLGGCAGCSGGRGRAGHEPLAVPGVVSFDGGRAVPLAGIAWRNAKPRGPDFEWPTEEPLPRGVGGWRGPSELPARLVIGLVVHNLGDKMFTIGTLAQSVARVLESLDDAAPSNLVVLIITPLSRNPHALQIAAKCDAARMALTDEAEDVVATLAGENDDDEGGDDEEDESGDASRVVPEEDSDDDLGADEDEDEGGEREGPDDDDEHENGAGNGAGDHARPDDDEEEAHAAEEDEVLNAPGMTHIYVAPVQYARTAASLRGIGGWPRGLPRPPYALSMPLDVHHADRCWWGPLLALSSIHTPGGGAVAVEAVFVGESAAPALAQLRLCRETPMLSPIEAHRLTLRVHVPDAPVHVPTGHASTTPMVSQVLRDALSVDTAAREIEAVFTQHSQDCPKCRLCGTAIVTVAQHGRRAADEEGSSVKICACPRDAIGHALRVR